MIFFYNLALLTPIFSVQDKFHPTPSVVRKVVPLPKSFQQNGFSKITLSDVFSSYYILVVVLLNKGDLS